MINPHNVLKVLSNLASAKSPCNPSSSISFDEEQIASHLHQCLNSIMESTSHLFKTETTLDHDDELDNERLENLLLSTSTDIDIATQKDADYQPIDEHNLQNHLSLDYMKRLVDCFDEIDTITGKRKRTWKTIKHLFRRVQNPKCIARFGKYLEEGGTRYQKMDIIDIYVYDQFEHARYHYLSIHDIDLQRWGHKKARELNLRDFQGSKTWLSNFKQRHGICSRKITKLVKKTVAQNKEEIKQLSKNFVSETNRIIERYSPNPVLNTDQIGIELEPHGGINL